MPVKLRMPDYYKDFQCVGGDCPDTCCRDWAVVLDEETAAFYRSADGALGADIRAAMGEIDGETCLQLSGGKCPMLNTQGLCRIQLRYGAEGLCRSCDLHPRFAEEYGALREWSLSMACPEAVRLLLRDASPSRFLEETTDEPLTSFNDLNPQLYLALFSARIAAFSIAQNRNYSIDARLAQLLRFASALQRTLNQHRIARLSAVTARFASDTFSRIQSLPEEDSAQLARLRALVPINEHWGALVQQSCAVPHDAGDTFERETASLSYEYEHLLVYYLYRYFLKAVNDRVLLPRVQLGIFAVQCIRALEYAHWRTHGTLSQHARIDIIHRFSREVEHSSDNLELLYQCFSEHS